MEEPRLPVYDNGEWMELKDGQAEGIYINENDKIYMRLEEKNRSKDLLHEVDIASFRICINTKYAKDKYRVYYPIYYICLDAIGGGRGIRLVDYVIEGADPATFKYIGGNMWVGEFAADSLHMYNDGTLIEWDNEVIRSDGLKTSHVKYYDGFNGPDTAYLIKRIDR